MYRSYIEAGQARRPLCWRQRRAVDTGGYMRYRVLYYARVAAEALCAAPRLPRLPKRQG